MPLPNDNIPSTIQVMIMYAIRDHLKVELVDNVPQDNPTRAVVVKVGRFLDNPIDENVTVAIVGGDFTDEDFLDGRVDHPDLQDVKIRFLPTAEVGGPEYWWRRFSIHMSCFFIRKNYDEETASQYAYEFLGRLVKALESAPTNGLTDDFGESSYQLPYLESERFTAGGGKGKWIFRGKLRFRLLTSRPLRTY